MLEFSADDVDFRAWMRDTECKAKVRRASVFADDLDAEFQPPTSRSRRSMMTSTKMRSAIEFRPAEVTTWAGYNGHRKSMFLGQVALDLCAQAEPVLVISLEMLAQKTLYRMARQACATDFPSRESRDQFMRWTDGRMWLFDHVGRLEAPLCLAVCRYFAEQLSGRHVVIDSMMKVLRSEESLDEQKQLMGDLCDVAKETGLHLHLVAHCRKPSGDGEDRPPTKYDIRGSSAISDQSHNVVTVWQNKAKRVESEKPAPDPAKMDRPDAIVSIEKQRNGTFEGKFGFWLDNRSLRFCDSDLAPVEPYPMYGGAA